MNDPTRVSQGEDETESASDGNGAWSVIGGGRKQKTPPGIHKIKKPNAWAEAKSANGGSAPRERSPTKDRQPARKMDHQQQQPPSSVYVIRYKNLKQAIEEAYVTCRSDQTAEKCAEVLRLMSTGMRDFEALRGRILQLHEKAEKTDVPPDRPNFSTTAERKSTASSAQPANTSTKASSERKCSPSAAWHTDTSLKASSECKSSPSSAQQADASPKASVAGSPNFVGFPSTPAAPPLSNTGPSWADRVKGSPPSLSVASNAYPTKPSSAAIVTKVVNPVAQPSKSKDVPVSKDVHSHYRPQQRAAAQLPRSQALDARANHHPLSGQPVPVELRKEHVQEVSRGDTPSRDSARPPTPPRASFAQVLSSAPMTSLPTAPVTSPVAAPSPPSLDRSHTPKPGAAGGANSVLGQGEAPTTAVLESVTVVLASKSEDEVFSELPDEDAVAGAIPEEEQEKLTLEFQAEHDNLERRNEEAIASAIIAEEEKLIREIQAEHDFLERANKDEEEVIGAEDHAGTEGDLSSSVSVGGGLVLNMDWNDIVRDYEAREPWRRSMSWGAIVEMEPSRPPAGHGIYAAALERFSHPPELRRSPTTLAASKRKCEERQLIAQQNRDKIREENLLQLQRFHERQAEVRKDRERQLEERRRSMEEKHSHAECRRERHLHAIVRKAQEEDAKVNEIAVINALEAQNKRHDARIRQSEYEQRLAEQAEERQRRAEEKQAHDRAVQERKRAIEADRRAKLEELKARRREQERRVERERQEKERAREDAARERARDQEKRLERLSAAELATAEELRAKIQIKFDESSRRHMEQMEQRKEKAAELSSGIGGGGGRLHVHVGHPPRLTPYERRKRCTLCAADIASDVHLLAHAKGGRHQQAVRDNSSIQGRELSEEEVEHLSLRKYIVEATPVESASAGYLAASEGAAGGREERQKARKRARKLRARMTARSKESEAAKAAAESAKVPESSQLKGKLERLARDIAKHLQVAVKDGGQQRMADVSGVSKNLREIVRILEKRRGEDQAAFRQAGGFSALELILQDGSTGGGFCDAPPPTMPLNCLRDAARAYYLACSGCPANCSYNLFSNKAAVLVDLLLNQLNQLDEPSERPCASVNPEVFQESLTTALLQTTATILGLMGPGEGDHFPDGDAKKAFVLHVRDLIGYTVSAGLVERLGACFLSVQGPVDDDPEAAAFLRQAATLLCNLCSLCFAVTAAGSSGKRQQQRDPTGLSAALLQDTDMAGVVHALYCVLLHGPATASPRDNPESAAVASADAGYTRIYPPSVARAALQSVRFVNSCALLDLPTAQAVLGAEGLSLAFRHVLGALLAHACCSSSGSQPSCAEELLDEVIVCAGYFVVGNPDNQAAIAQPPPSSAGAEPQLQPSVLQQLCRLPFRYFSQPRLTEVLFPTLIAACHGSDDNKRVLQQDVSSALLATFLQDRCCHALSLLSDDKNECQGGERKRRHGAEEEETAPPRYYCELSNRLPRDQWDSALHFFQQK